MKKIAFFSALALLLVAAMLGYQRWEREQSAIEQNTVLGLMNGATAALRADVTPGQDPTRQAQTLIAAAERVEQDLTTLRAASTQRVEPLSTGAAEYLNTGRELLKRRAAIVGLDAQIHAGMGAVRRHMLGRRADSDWTHEALRLMNQLEAQFRDYQRSIDSHTNLSDDFTQTCGRIAPLLPVGHLIGVDQVAAARDKLSALGQAANAQMQALRGALVPRS